MAVAKTSLSMAALEDEGDKGAGLEVKGIEGALAESEEVVANAGWRRRGKHLPGRKKGPGENFKEACNTEEIPEPENE